MNARFDARTNINIDLLFHGQSGKGHRSKTLIKSGRMVTFSSGRTAIFKNKR